MASAGTTPPTGPGKAARSPDPSPDPPTAAPSVAPPAASTPAGRSHASHRSRTGYLGALWIIAPLMPGLASIITIGGYLFLPPKAGTTAPADPIMSIAVGVAVTFAIWFVGAFFARPLVSAPRAQLRLYSELLERSRSLRDRSASLTPSSDEAQAAAAEIGTHLDYVDEELEGEGMGAALRWALASGYMSVVRALHRVDEALLMAEPEDAAVGDALHDALSLEGSTIGNRDRLSGILRAAVDRLSPASAAAFFMTGSDRKAAGEPALSENEAREGLREVRHAINEYRDDRHDGLIRARNRLVWTMLAVGITTYLLLSLALIADVPVNYVQTVAVFYLVGAIVGLFNRLRIESGQASAVEDFGLSQARLVVTPLVSGLAAVAGVYLIAAAPALLPTGTTDHAVLPPLTTVYDLALNPIGLIYAAIFGLAPGSVTSRLALASARLEKDLQSTEAANGRSPDADAGPA
jgi:hypothetical protein